MTTSSDPQSMKTARKTGIRHIELVEVDRPHAGPGTAVARLETIGICGSDLHPYLDDTQPLRTPDGHEICGVVVEVGEGVTNVRVGDRVAVDNCASGRGCGVCEYCQRGSHVHCCGDQFPLNNGYSEFITTRAAGFYRLPDAIDNRLGALVEPLAVGVHAIRWMRMDPRGCLVVLGAGTIGLCTLIAARALGHEQVYITAKHPFQADLARELGATGLLPTEPEAAKEALMEATSGKGADYVVEAVGGRADTVNLACSLAKGQAMLGILGVFDEKLLAFDFQQALLKELTVTFPSCYSIIEGRHDFEVSIDIVARQPGAMARLITHEFALEDIAKAFEVAADKSSRSVKVMLHP